MIKLLLVSHSLALAQATKDFCEKMLPLNQEVIIKIVGGDDQGQFGNSINKIMQELKNTKGISDTAIIYDLGSAKIMLDIALNQLNNSHLQIIESPFVEGAFIAYSTLNSTITLKAAKKIIEAQMSK